MKKIFGKIIGFIIIALMILLLGVNIVLAVKTNKNPDEIPSIFGHKLFIVMSGSMQSKINIGDMVVIKEIDAKELKTNDIIAFKGAENQVTTHRIINVVNDNGEIGFETKGDSNNVKDEAIVHINDIEGKMVFNIPKIGELVLFIQKPLGIFLSIIVILLIVGIMFIIENQKSSGKRYKDKQYMKEFEEFKKQKMEEEKTKENNE